MKDINSANHRSAGAALIHDLLSFDSWEFYNKETTPSLAEGTEATSVATSLGSDGVDNLMLWLAASEKNQRGKAANVGNEEYVLNSSSEDSSETCDTTAAVHAAGETDIDKDQGIKSNDRSIQVSISGVIFSIKEDVVPRLSQLPWTLIQAPKCEASEAIGQCNKSLVHIFSSTTEKAMIPHLQTSPVLFELLLNTVMFGSVPNLKCLTKADAEELEPLTILLELDFLTAAIQQRLKNRGSSRRNGGFAGNNESKGNRRKSSSFSNRSLKPKSVGNNDAVLSKKENNSSKKKSEQSKRLMYHKTKSASSSGSMKHKNMNRSSKSSYVQNDGDDDDDKNEQFEQGGSMMLESLVVLPTEIVSVVRKWQTSWLHRKLTKKAADDDEIAIS